MWEYRVLYWDDGTLPPAFTELGQHGWELATSNYLPAMQSMQYVFKRPKVKTKWSLDTSEAEPSMPTAGDVVEDLK